jgi:hypothetical protein
MEVRDLCPGPVLGKDWSGPFSAGPYIGLGNHREGGGGEGVLGFYDYNTYSIPNLLYKKWHDPGSYVCRQKVTNIT